MNYNIKQIFDSFKSFLRILLPKNCPNCNCNLGISLGICIDCQNKLIPKIKKHYINNIHLITFGRFYKLKKIIYALKYKNSLDIGIILGEKLAKAIPQEWNIKYVVAVPLHYKRQKKRGFNQSEIIAKSLAKALGVDYKNALKRIKETKQQAKLSAEERSENVKNAFVREEYFCGNILLVDDVCTTGKTLKEAAKALAGNTVYFASLAY